MKYADWFYKLTQREQAKQIRRWRYYRMYYRRKFGPTWQWHVLYNSGL